LGKIGENIRFYRHLRSLTQTALARKVQVAPAYISQIEANQRIPSLKVTRRIANVLGIEMSVLVREADPRAQEGRLSDSEKLDLLRTLMMAIEGESRSAETETGLGTAEAREVVATELYGEPAYSVVLREFTASGTFGREVGDADVECHVVLEGRVREVGESAEEVAVGECRSLSGPGLERLAASRGARVLSIYSPRVGLKALVAGTSSGEIAARTSDETHD
jgi:transcriptional regulator with XRE-family HTH domain